MKDKISIIAGGSGQLGVYLSRYLLKKGYDVVGYGLKLCNELGSFNNYYKKLIEAKNIHDNTYFLPLFDDMSKKDTIKVVTMSDDERARWKKVTEYMYEKYDDMFSPGLLDSIKNAA